MLPDEDGWLSVDNLRKNIYALDVSKSHIVVGFSEYARFLSEDAFITVIISLLELENKSSHSKRRIYLPCFALYGQVKKIVQEYHRRRKVYNPFLNTAQGEDLPKIFFINNELDNVGYHNEINSAAKWFGMWKNSVIKVDKPLISTSPTLSYFYTQAFPDNVYNIKKISTYPELLLCLYGIDGLTPGKQISDEYYRQLIKLMRSWQNKSLKAVTLQTVNAQEITHENVYSLWKDASEFNKWLIQNCVLLYDTSNAYLRLMMEDIELLTAEAFIESAYLCIFEKENDSLYAERNKIINSIKRAEQEIKFTPRMKSNYENLLLEIIKKQPAINLEIIDFTKDFGPSSENTIKLSSDIQNRLLPIMTDNSVYERQMLIWLFRAGLADENLIKPIYPNLWEYLNGTGLDLTDGDLQDRFTVYFDVYRNCRLGKDTGKQYDEAVVSWNANEEKFYNWYTDSQIDYPEGIFKKQGFTGKICVLDGVGAEFLAYILVLLERRNYKVDYVTYAKTHLPTITSLAKSFYQFPNTWIRDYDTEVVHGKIYYHSENIEMALTVLEKIVNRLTDEAGDEPFAITADHGATVGHKLFKRKKLYNFEAADHDGRCCLQKEGQKTVPSIDYIVHTDELSCQWIIALNEQSLCNTSKYAVHGGATPEEILVPLIITRKNNSTIKAYKVTPQRLRVSGLQREVAFKILPKPDVARLTAKDGTNVSLAYDPNKKVWTGQLKRGKAQDIIVHIESRQFLFKTETSNQMGGAGEDGFDD
jgi:hypothetical protein